MGFILVADINYSLYLLEFLIFFGKNALNLFFLFLLSGIENFFLQRSTQKFFTSSSLSIHKSFVENRHFVFRTALPVSQILPTVFWGSLCRRSFFEHYAHIWKEFSRTYIFTFALVLLIRCWLEFFGVLYYFNTCTVNLFNSFSMWQEQWLS